LIKSIRLKEQEKEGFTNTIPVSEF